MKHQNLPRIADKLHRLSPKLLSRAKEMRQDPAPAEKLLWKHLRGEQLSNLKFRRQVPIGNYIADFYCASCRVVIELDGESHLDRVDYDADRTAWLRDQNIRVLRFGNDEVFENIEGVLLAIASACGKPLANLDLLPSPRPSPCKGEGGKT